MTNFVAHHEISTDCDNIAGSDTEDVNIDIHDTSYNPDSSDDDNGESTINLADNSAIFMSWGQVRKLFSYCFTCGADATISKIHRRGMLSSSI